MYSSHLRVSDGRALVQYDAAIGLEILDQGTSYTGRKHYASVGRGRTNDCCRQFQTLLLLLQQQL